MTPRIPDVRQERRLEVLGAQRRANALDPQPISLNLHGNSSEPVDVTLSDGTLVAGPDTDLVQRLRSALWARSVKVKSCNWPPDGLTAKILVVGGAFAISVGLREARTAEVLWPVTGLPLAEITFAVQYCRGGRFASVGH
jgi:hypothetical protein